MTTDEEKKITAWGQSLEHDIVIELTTTEDDRSAVFRNFCEHLSRMAPKVRMQKEAEEAPAPPHIRVRNVRYRAIPVAGELDPFLRFLAGADDLAGQLAPDLRAQLDKLRLPAFVKVYIMPHCPFCPQVVTQLLSLAAANEWIKLTVVDGALFPEQVEADRVRSAPTVLLEDRFRWTGSVQTREIVDVMLNRDPAQLSAASLREMIANGDAAAVAKMMLDSGTLFPAFLELLAHKKWPVRLGAMVVFETVLAERRELALRSVPVLWEYFSEADDTVRGDIVYLLGNCRDEGVIPLLETVLNGPYSAEVIEAAAEALEAFSARGSSGRES